MRSIRIGGASGFWGDSAIAFPQLLREPLDFVCFDYLAEITMSILARARAKDPSLGYVPEFVTLMARHAATLKQRGIRVLANAGGVNPRGCARAIEALLAEAGVALKVGVVLGDDFMAHADAWRAADRREMFSGEPMPSELLSLNAYLGAEPVARLLDEGADIVITGRCADSALALGAGIHAFGWGRDALDARAGGSLAGHIIECGAQATGGLHTDWDRTGDWADIGYPVVELRSDGSFLVTKPAGTGGLVSVGTVAEQMLYEIGDPGAYILPDLICDFRDVEMEATGENEVFVRGAKGREPTANYKASATWADGFRVGAYYMIGGIDAVAKAEKVGEAVLRRCAAMLESSGMTPYTETSVEVIGSESSYGETGRGRKSREVMLKIAAKHNVPRALEMLVREFTSAGTSMAPGFTGMGGNRPKVTPVVRLFSILAPKAEADISIEINGQQIPMPDACPVGPDRIPKALATPLVEKAQPKGSFLNVPLIRLAFARSGDKGNSANIGVIARRPEYLPFIAASITAETVQEIFAHYLKGSVERFHLPGIHALNFLLHDVLGGGGIASLRSDPQGKAYAQILLDHLVPVPVGILEPR